MSKWSGLDSAGVEFLWDEDVLVSVLRIFDRHSPVAYSDSSSPIYEELSEQFPERTWFKKDANGFRPIFRRANPLAKLGLIEGDGRGAVVTELGRQLLDDEIQLDSVFQGTLKMFAEHDGERSFARMARAGLLLPNHAFSLEDIEYAVSRSSPGFENLDDELEAVRAKRLQVSSAGNRVRKLRSFMNALVNSGAFAPSDQGWMLDNLQAANEIVGESLNWSSLDHLELPEFGNLEGKGRGSKEIAPGKRTVPTINSSKLSRLDPARRALLLEKAHSEHERVIELAAASIRIAGGTPFEDPNSFDVACDAPRKMLIEAKHITRTNAVSQFRKALAQLPEYRWRHRDRFDVETMKVAALSCDPRPFVEGGYLDFVEEDQGIPVIWREEDRLIDRHGKSLQDYLGQP